jgi:hypothetical protein
VLNEILAPTAEEEEIAQGRKQPERKEDDNGCYQ